MFDRIWGFMKGDKEGNRIDYPLDREVAAKEVRAIALRIDVNDFAICPNRKEAGRLYRQITNLDMQAITRSVMYQGKACVKVWRIR